MPFVTSTESTLAINSASEIVTPADQDGGRWLKLELHLTEFVPGRDGSDPLSLSRGEGSSKNKKLPNIAAMHGAVPNTGSVCYAVAEGSYSKAPRSRRPTTGRVSSLATATYSYVGVRLKPFALPGLLPALMAAVALLVRW